MVAGAPELAPETAQAWIARWDLQQQDHLPDREERFTALIDAVAEGMAGSEEAFADRMNKKAKELGLTGSVFKNSSGWPAEEISAAKIPITYVPARNTVFLSLALAWAETLGATDIFIGVNALDYSGYPDCRPEYIQAFERMANLATKAGVEGRQDLRIHTPLIDLTKAQIIQQGRSLGVDYGLTHSCYDPGPSGRPCGCCSP